MVLVRLGPARTLPGGTRERDVREMNPLTSIISIGEPPAWMAITIVER